MQSTNSTTWQKKLSTALAQDPKKTGVLGVLALMLLVMGGRLLLQNDHPATVSGSIVPPGITNSAAVVPSYRPAPFSRRDATSASLRDWLVAPLPPLSHNMFLLKPEYFAADTAKTVQEIPDGGFWLDLEKSLSFQADQKDKRETLIESLKVQAAGVRPQSTVMGPSPRAMINGTLVAEGEMIASFRVLKIQPRGLIVERDGVRLAIPMK